MVGWVFKGDSLIHKEINMSNGKQYFQYQDKYYPNESVTLNPKAYQN